MLEEAFPFQNMIALARFVTHLCQVEVLEHFLGDGATPHVFDERGLLLRRPKGRRHRRTSARSLEAELVSNFDTVDSTIGDFCNTFGL